MIKILKNKFLICFFLFVTVFSVTSSCFAFSNLTSSDSLPDGFNVSSLKEFLVNTGYTNYDDGAFFLYAGKAYTSGYSYSAIVFREDYKSKFFKLKENDSTANMINFINSSGSTIKVTFMSVSFSSGNYSINYTDNAGYNFPMSSIGNIIYYSDYDVYDSSNSLVYTHDIPKSVEVSHTFQSDTSAKVNFDYSSYGSDCILQYSLSGVEPNADLTAPIKLRNPVTYTPRSNKFSC